MFHSFITERESEDGLMIGLKNRNIEQKFTYLGYGSSAYYSAYPEKGGDVRKDYTNNFLEFLGDKIGKDEKIVMISLGCGDSRQEFGILEAFSKERRNITYLGVDFSKDMLDLSAQTLGSLNIKKRHIYGDFTKSNFNEDILKLTKDYDKRIYLFLGSTFGNPNQTLITDTLYNLLNKGDLLLMDVLSRRDDSQKVIMTIFNRYKGYLGNQKMLDFILTPLTLLGVPNTIGEIVLETYSEHSIGAMVFNFGFVVKQKFVGYFSGERFHLLPEEKIDLLNIRNYNAGVFQYFMEEHEFRLVRKSEQNVNDFLKRLQFLRTVNK